MHAAEGVDTATRAELDLDATKWKKEALGERTCKLPTLVASTERTALPIMAASEEELVMKSAQLPS